MGGSCCVAARSLEAGHADVAGSRVRGWGSLMCDAPVTVGPDGDPSAVGPLPDSVRVERFVSQGVLLPYVDAVSHHGGSGTMLGALSHGLPQLVLPHGADQFLNAQAPVDSGTSCCLTPEENTPETVREASKGYSANRDTGSSRVGSPTRSPCRPPRRRSRNWTRSRLDRWASAEAVTALGHGADRSRRSEARSQPDLRRLTRRSLAEARDRRPGFLRLPEAGVSF